MLTVVVAVISMLCVILLLVVFCDVTLFLYDDFGDFSFLVVVMKIELSWMSRTIIIKKTEIMINKLIIKSHEYNDMEISNTEIFVKCYKHKQFQNDD